jgi:hypothetical protein
MKGIRVACPVPWKILIAVTEQPRTPIAIVNC